MPEFKYDRSNPGPCCQKIDDMIQYARPIVERWPSFHKRSLGVDIMQEMYTMLRLATKARLRYMNKSTLADLDTSKAVLDIFIQQANKIIFTDKSGKTRRLLTDQSYGEWSKKIDEIGALIGGWMNSVSGRKSGDSRGNAP
jgi:hypothetical protein